MHEPYRMNLLHLFDLSLVGRRSQTALECDGRTYTFGDIDERSNRTAEALRLRGIETGDRVCVYLPNCVEIVDLYLACLKLGAIFVPINILYRDREIAHIVADADPKCVVTRSELAAAVPVWQVADLLGDAALLERLAASLERLAAPLDRLAAPLVLRPVLDGDAPAALVYTSGTTGASKGAILTHNNFAANALNLLTCWQITDRDKLLLALPLFHIHALGNGLHCWLIGGFRMRLLERFEHRRATAEFLDFRPTVFFGVPTMYVRLLETPPDAAREIGRAMRLFVSGSAPLPAQVLEEFRTLFGHTILERYGMTETLMNIGNPYVGERRPGSIGLPLPGVSAALRDGEIHLRGPNVFAGYWRREQATREAFVDGWFRTGDIAERSPDGYYTLRGRKSDLIISGGYNIYPREIEEFLLEQPEIAEAAVAAAADPVRGEVPVAYVVLKSPVEVADLERRCRQSLASFKAPRKFHVVERLPRNALGKVQKHLLEPGPAKGQP
jgi:malonyl-CoA/methylmalonyl-CoA synthetase